MEGVSVTSDVKKCVVSGRRGGIFERLLSGCSCVDIERGFAGGRVRKVISGGVCAVLSPALLVSTAR